MSDQLPHHGARTPYSNPGLGVDSHGNPVIDPTKNVLDLVEAAVKRLDDMTTLRAALVDEKILRMEERANTNMEIGTLRAEHQKDIDLLEAKRLDAIRQVDQLAVKTEADRSAAAITALATTAATTAETLRNAVNTSATNLATQLTNTVNAITERIASLEKLSYTGQGRQAVADPQIADMISEMRQIRQAGDRVQGKTEGFSTSWAIVLAVFGLIATLMTIVGGGIAAYVATRPAPVPVSYAAPAQVQPPSTVYVPAPAGSMLPVPRTDPATVPGK